MQRFECALKKVNDHFFRNWKSFFVNTRKNIMDRERSDIFPSYEKNSNELRQFFLWMQLHRYRAAQMPTFINFLISTDIFFNWNGKKKIQKRWTIQTKPVITGKAKLCDNVSMEISITSAHSQTRGNFTNVKFKVFVTRYHNFWPNCSFGKKRLWHEQ